MRSIFFLLLLSLLFQVIFALWQLVSLAVLTLFVWGPFHFTFNSKRSYKWCFCPRHHFHSGPFFFALRISHVRIYMTSQKCCFSLILKYIPLVDCICIVRIKFQRYAIFFPPIRPLLLHVFVHVFFSLSLFLSQHFDALREKSVICSWGRNEEEKNERERKKMLYLYNCVWCQAEWVSIPSAKKIQIMNQCVTECMSVWISYPADWMLHDIHLYAKRFTSGSFPSYAHHILFVLRLWLFSLDIQCVSCVYTHSAQINSAKNVLRAFKNYIHSYWHTTVTAAILLKTALLLCSSCIFQYQSITYTNAHRHTLNTHTVIVINSISGSDNMNNNKQHQTPILNMLKPILFIHFTRSNILRYVFFPSIWWNVR